MEPTSSTSTATVVSVSPKHILLSEILSVTSVMRKNSRWALSTPSYTLRDSTLASSLGLRVSKSSPNTHASGHGSTEQELMAGFQDLKRLVKDIEDIHSLPLSTLLSPFLAIIRSPLSTGPITSAALTALHNFFLCGLFYPTAFSLPSALSELSSALSSCKFEASDSSGDEVVLLKIMTVINDAMCGDAGRTLGDIEICEMLETVLTTSCQMRLSEVLRRSAEETLHQLVRAVFARLHELNPEAEEQKLDDTGDLESGEVKMSVSTSGPAPQAQEPDSSAEQDAPSQENGEVQVAEVSSSPHAQEQPPETPSQPHGLPSILELLRVLINILDPNDQAHTDSTRLTALRTLNVALEATGSRICAYPSLSALILDHGCKYLFQLARSDHPAVLQTSLRAIATMFETMRPKLKLQQELFLAFTIDRLTPLPPPKNLTLNQKALSANSRGSSPAPGTPLLAPPEDDSEKTPATPRILVPPARGDTRELLLETLCQISRHPSFMVDLYTNYDCDMNCENMFERLIEFCAKGIYPSQGLGGPDNQQHNAQYLCLDLILAFVGRMATRAEGASETWPRSFPPPEQLQLTKSKKKLILTGTAKFNTKPKTGLAFLEENKLIYADPNEPKPLSLAKFLKSSARIDKRLLGDFISKPDNIEVLKAFLSLMDFKGKSVAEALREMLETFRLPGEAQQISRITETFAEIYFAAEPDEIKSQDAVYVLAFSIIMLNTDQHSPQIRKRMTLEDYKRNLKGVNEGADFTPEFLSNIYESIRKREIVMPEEHTGQLGFEYAWKELLARTRQAGDFLTCNSAIFDADMFKAVWRLVVSAIAYAFITFEDDYIIEKAIAGFRQCATLARHFDMPDVFDYVVISLSQATSLLSESQPSQVPNYPVVDVDGQSTTVSSLSVKFGTNFKGQLAAVVLFNIVNGNANALREGWTQIFEMFQTLFLHSLLPPRMLQMEDFLSGSSVIPLRRSQPARAVPRSDGLLSALSSYLMTPYASSTDALVPDATDADIENTLCTIDCISTCRLDELYSQIMQLEPEALVAAIRALEALAHERTVAKLKLESDEAAAAAAAQGGQFALPYDPASVFLLETMVSIARQTPQYIEEVWPIVFEHLSALLSTPTQYSILLIERAVVALLRLCLILAERHTLRDQIYLSFDLLARLPPSVASAVAEQVVAGLTHILQQHREIVHSQTEWNVVFALLRSTISHPEASRQSFDILAALVGDGPQDSVTPDNFTGLVNALDEFATVAGIAVDAQQQGRRTQALTAANSPIVERGRKAVDMIADLKKCWARFAETSGLQRTLIWRQFSLPVLSSLARQSSNTSREIRHTALVHLQRILLGPHLPLDEGNHNQIEEVFNRVIFPLLDELLKQQVFMRDPMGMPETRLRASALLCKAFMQFEAREGQTADIRVLWIQVLDLLDRLMHVDRRDQLYEAVPESLKNVLLVMNATGLLVPPSTPEDDRGERQVALWAATHERVERFLPGFLDEIVPAPPPKSAGVPASSASAPSS
ncbi:Sec7-domain-containing protein [Dichomitus squalens LYAD-421 SS1]|uniref:Sec7-domain-containing protein n=1 Tax=Dichomitus squalens TaxID=114155 RepID=A0A4Q9QFK3_9APHY|nr:Sec7-domain-containing protein [Dichomitus squalens LYAD-421 SS1]EJF65717.1 Sec7-domain-containing protein [Dichomitus squalens LYAD-421 SS1]TBU66001.1 Sec7-domain-containing protein [Dichomitus squalens]